MANTITLEQVEELATQLPPTEQLKLVAHLCDQLSTTLPVAPAEKDIDEQARQEWEAPVNAWLTECEQIAELWEGEFDSAADLRRIRDEET